MKKTIIALMALSGVAFAATDMVYWAGTTGADILTVDSGHNNMPYLGRADGGARMGTDVITTLTSEGNSDYNLHFNQVGASASFAVNDAIYLNSIFETDGETPLSSYSIAFGSEGSITTSSSINWGSSLSSLTLSATLSSAEVAALSSGNNVFRTLITTDHFANTTFTSLSTALTLGTLSGADLSKGGVIFAIKPTDEDVTAYYSLDDVSVKKKDGADTIYVELNKNAEQLTLDAGTSYLVLSATLGDGGSMKQISYLATAPIPEPTTATLSLLALAGLAARRRRK